MLFPDPLPFSLSFFFLYYNLVGFIYTMDPEKAKAVDNAADEDVEQQTIHNDGQQPKPDEIRPAVVRTDSEKTAIPTVNPPPRRKFLARMILGDRPAPDRQFSKNKKLMILATVAIAGTM